MTQLRTSMVIDLTGNLASRANQFMGSLRQLGAGGAREMGILSRSVTAVSHGLDRLGNRYTALLSGAAGIGAVKMVGDLTERFTYLGITAQVTDAEISKLKQSIFEIAAAPDIRVDPSEIVGAIETIVEKTGDLKFAKDNIRNIGLAIRATRADGASIGGILAEFQKLDKSATPDQVLQALDILNVQGKEGAFTLQKLASLGPRVFAAYGGRRTTDLLTFTREMGAALQVIQTATGSPEQAATTFEALLRVLSDKNKLKVLQQGGIKVFDEKSLKAGGDKLRPINELLVEIFKRARGKASILSGVIQDSEAMRAFLAPALVENLKRFYDVHADGTVTLKDSARAAAGFNGAVQNLHTNWQKFADSNLARPVQRFADYLNTLKPETVERWIKMSGALGALVVAGKTLTFGRSVFDVFRGGKGGGGVGGGIPVHVTNMPGTGGSAKDMFGNPLPPYRPGGKVPWTSTALTGGAIVLPFASMLLSRPIGEAMAENEASKSSTARLHEILARQMVMGGGPSSYQARLITQELQKRGEFGGQLTVVVEDNRVRLKNMSSHGGLTLDVTTGPMTAGRMP